MTHTDAGRALDREIAEAMGWRNITDDELGESPGHYGYTPIPHYSTDLNAAIGLAEGDYLKLCSIPSRGMWEASFALGNSGPWGRAETPALAICRAFILDREKQRAQGEG